VALALLARLIPEMDIFFMGMPAQAALGLFLAAAFLPLIGAFLTEMSDWMAKLLPI
jgi:flagellar biosynthesis protein FliR